MSAYDFHFNDILYAESREQRFQEEFSFAYTLSPALSRNTKKKRVFPFSIFFFRRRDYTHPGELFE